MQIRATRLLDRPIIGPDLHPSIGANIQGPTLIRVPDWLPGRLGAYYLYFADHKGSYIRLAYADALTGPWHIHPPGSLHLAQSGFPTTPPAVSPDVLAQFEARYAARGQAISHDVLAEITTPHIASPDVHVDAANRRILMYFHGLEAPGRQVTRIAVSVDGIAFTAQPEILGPSYMRIFPHDGMTYALAMPGIVSRSADGAHGFTNGPTLFNPNMRHAALLRRGHRLLVFWTQVGDAPETILMSQIDLSGDWMGWRDSAPVEILRPERPWEGATAPRLPSIRSTAYGQVNQLRDPAIYTEGDTTYLLYAVAGESGIALARLDITD